MTTPEGDDHIFAELASSYERPNALQAAVAQAEQQLMNAWHATNPKDGSLGPSNVQVMEEAWAKLTDDERAQAMKQLFNAYWHHAKEVQQRADVAAMAKIQGSTFLEDMDLDTLEFAHVSVLDGDWMHGDAQITEAGIVRDHLHVPEEVLPKMATVHVELEVVWRLIQELRLLQFRIEHPDGTI